MRRHLHVTPIFKSAAKIKVWSIQSSYLLFTQEGLESNIKIV